jgi:hypothetical protein
MVDRYKGRDSFGRIVLAVTSSGTVASWAIWDQFPSSWQALSALSALIAIAVPVLNLPARIETAAELHGRWTELAAEYELLWTASEDGQGDLTEEQMQKFVQKELGVAPKEASIPYDRRLAKRCQEEVRRRWRLE